MLVILYHKGYMTEILTKFEIPQEEYKVICDGIDAILQWMVNKIRGEKSLNSLIINILSQINSFLKDHKKSDEINSGKGNLSSQQNHNKKEN